MGRRRKDGAPRGLFFFWDTMGLPIDIAINHIRSVRELPDLDIFWMIVSFIEDAQKAGWKDSKIKGDLREADFCGHLNLKQWFPKLYDENRH